MSTAADTMNEAARKIHLRTSKNKAAVTIQLDANGPSPLGAVYDPFNSSNPINDSRETDYNESEIQEQLKEVKGFSKEK